MVFPLQLLQKVQTKETTEKSSKCLEKLFRCAFIELLRSVGFSFRSRKIEKEN